MQRLVRVEFIAGQQPTHGIAPASHLMQAQRCATEWEDPALDFFLGEAGIARTQVDVGRQHQLDADGQAIALNSDDHRFADPRPGEHAPGIATTGRRLPAFGQVRGGAEEVETGGEVLAMGKHHGHPRFVVGLQFTVGQAQFVEQVEVEGVAFGHPVEANQQDMAVALTGDTTAGRLVHGHFPRGRHLGEGRRDGGETF